MKKIWGSHIRRNIEDSDLIKVNHVLEPTKDIISYIVFIKLCGPVKFEVQCYLPHREDNVICYHKGEEELVKLEGITEQTTRLPKES